MKLRYWIIVLVLLLGGLGLAMRFYFFPGHQADPKSETPSHSDDSEKHAGEKPTHDSPSEKQGHKGDKHASSEKKDDHHDDHKDDHGKDGKEEEEHDDHGEAEEEESVGGVGKNNAVTAADEHDGIRLSPKAVAAMGIKTAPYKNGFVPVPALVRYQDNTGVYRLRDGWIKLIPVKIKNQKDDVVSLIASDLEPTDQIVIIGTGLVRAAELDAFTAEAGHGH